MNFEWDENKRQTNLRKHGIDFVDVEEVFDGYTLTIEDDREDYGKQRFITLGMIQGRVVVVAHTEDEQTETIRVFSVRKATKYEQKKYFEKVAD
jgi:uncharacterized protein